MARRKPDRPGSKSLTRRELLGGTAKIGHCRGRCVVDEYLRRNTLWKGRVADPDVQDADIRAIRDVNARIFNDARVDVSVDPVGDGLTFVYKR